MSDGERHHRERLRATFTEDAELYERARPRYPAALFDDLAELARPADPAAPAGRGPGVRVLEIGCGTGQATMHLAERGWRITAVELGPEMGAVARRRLARFPAVRVETAAFEDWPLPDEPFDVVLSATAFHWIDPATRMDRAADALRVGGVLATVTTHHVAGGSEEFFVEVQDCYERFDPATPPGLRLTAAADIPRDGADVEGSDRFGPAAFRRHEVDLEYTTAQYLDVLNTYSNHRALEPAARAGLLGAIGRLIDDRHGGRITKRHLFELRVAPRTA